MCELYTAKPLLIWRKEVIARQKLAVIVVTALLGWVAQSQTPVRPVVKPIPADAALESAIRQRLAKTKSANDKFTVRVQGGVATIEGKTDVVQHKGTATRMAKLAGAKQVVNRIVVSDAARQQASSTLVAGRRRAQVKRSDVKR
jgi:outer membrane lipoprotein-sorting protein